MTAVPAADVEAMPTKHLAACPTTIVVDDETLAFDWGEIHVLGTAAYWVEQTRRLSEPVTYRLGDTLAEEVAACILGGYGIPAAVGLAAFRRLREEGLLNGPVDEEALAGALASPLTVPGRARPIRYRFAAQRSQRVAAALTRLAEIPALPDDPGLLRAVLLSLPGVGPKTASWIVRNWGDADGVAIIDVHLRRAGLAAGFFSADWQLPRDYDRFETAFCAIAEIGDVSTAALDACIWDQMQALGPAQALFFARKPRAAKR